MKKTNEKMVKGYKGFSPGMICRDKQYAENTLFHEQEAKMCEKGMHFCFYPLDVLSHYPPIIGSEISEYAEVEAPCSKVLTGDADKCCTNELHIKNKLSIGELCQAAIYWVQERLDLTKSSKKIYTMLFNQRPLMAFNNDDFSFADDDAMIAINAGEYSVSNGCGGRSISVNIGDRSVAKSASFDSVVVNTGCNAVAENLGRRSIALTTGACSIVTNLGENSIAISSGMKSAADNIGNFSLTITKGDCSVATNSGNRSAAITTGYGSIAVVTGKESLAIAIGRNSKVKGALGCWLVCVECDGWNSLINVRSVLVDGEKIKADTYYMLKNGKFVEVEDA